MPPPGSVSSTGLTLLTTKASRDAAINNKQQPLQRALGPHLEQPTLRGGEHFPSNDARMVSIPGSIHAPQLQGTAPKLAGLNQIPGTTQQRRGHNH